MLVIFANFYPFNSIKNNNSFAYVMEILYTSLFLWNFVQVSVVIVYYWFIYTLKSRRFIFGFGAFIHLQKLVLSCKYLSFFIRIILRIKAHCKFLFFFRLVKEFCLLNYTAQTARLIAICLPEVYNFFLYYLFRSHK